MRRIIPRWPFFADRPRLAIFLAQDHMALPQKWWISDISKIFHNHGHFAGEHDGESWAGMWFQFSRAIFEDRLLKKTAASGEKQAQQGQWLLRILLGGCFVDQAKLDGSARMTQETDLRNLSCLGQGLQPFYEPASG